MEISDTLRERLNANQRVCVLTGAGVSAESGVPTFRGDGQSIVWKGMPFDQISSSRMVSENLPEVWEWFDYRRGVLKDCKPNPAHDALCAWQKCCGDFTLITQNVDGLHTRAGSHDVLELHGNINRSYCVACAKRFFMDADLVPHQPGVCDDCGSPVRPDVVLFGEMLPMDIFARAEEKTRAAELFFVIGTSAVVYPAAGLARFAAVNGAYLVEINPEETAMTGVCHETISGLAGEILPALVNDIL